jgi:1,4-dihydroxy-6-naphthoate synthase
VLLASATHTTSPGPEKGRVGRVQISLAYSVDADDAFMFHALVTGAIDTRGLTFEHRRGDTAWLNGLAEAGGADVVAVSAGAYPSFADKYLLLPHGASVGRGFGPVVVAKRPMTLADLAHRRVAIPGFSTTAFLVLRLMQPAVVPVFVPIAPFRRVFEALDQGEVDAALLIHEGRLLFENRGCVAVAELGEWWLGKTGLPLPLGVNVIRRALGQENIMQVSAVLRAAIAYALDNRGEVIRTIAAEKRGEVALAETAILDRYLGMYANDDTRTMAPDVRKAIDVLFARSADAGLLPLGCQVEWSP